MGSSLSYQILDLGGRCWIQIPEDPNQTQTSSPASPMQQLPPKQRSVLTQVDSLQRTPMVPSGNLLTQESRVGHSETTSASPGLWDCFLLRGHRNRSTRTRASRALWRRKASNPASASAFCSRKSKRQERIPGKMCSASYTVTLFKFWTRGHGVSGGVHSQRPWG